MTDQFQSISLRYHQARVNDLLVANNVYLTRARDAEGELRDLIKSIKTCEANVTTLAHTIIDVLLEGQDEAKRNHEATILSQRLYDFLQEFVE